MLFAKGGYAVAVAHGYYFLKKREREREKGTTTKETGILQEFLGVGLLGLLYIMEVVAVSQGYIQSKWLKKFCQGWLTHQSAT